MSDHNSDVVETRTISDADAAPDAITALEIKLYRERIAALDDIIEQCEEVMDRYDIQHHRHNTLCKPHDRDWK